MQLEELQRLHSVAVYKVSHGAKDVSLLCFLAEILNTQQMECSRPFMCVWRHSYLRNVHCQLPTFCQHRLPTPWEQYRLSIMSNSCCRNMPPQRDKTSWLFSVFLASFPDSPLALFIRGGESLGTRLQFSSLSHSASIHRNWWTHTKLHDCSQLFNLSQPAALIVNAVAVRKLWAVRSAVKESSSGLSSVHNFTLTHCN